MIGTVVSKLLGIKPSEPPPPVQEDPLLRTCWRCEVSWRGKPFCWVCRADVRYQRYDGGL